ncbi:aldo/keto reductase [Gordonia sp. HY285]|uniref:aldo/keto reductase n=1 Tax=Gordonia liuliyuniae TaxID=2911517 RepID=UPI001F2C4B23|nr:aldo/keto reductase [Gordonia liuliyuniae]MCF8611024.1 aldo/keto reductase [Gordonia liuliyuniae]
MATIDPSFPTVALGTWAWGDTGESGDGIFGSRFTESDIAEIVDRGQSSGLTFWDTAAIYGMGRSETVLAHALSGYERGDYQISTKFTPRIAGDGENPVADMLNESLTRLGTDYVDLYWIHSPADVARWTPQLIPLLQAGTVKRVGVSNHDLDEIELADSILRQAGFRVDAVQNHYSLLYRNSERAGILDHCAENGIAFFSYMVLEQGALTGVYRPDHPLPEGSTRAAVYNRMLPRLKALTDLLTSIGNGRDSSAADVATAWAIAKGTVPIIGVTRPEYIGDAVNATGLALSRAEIDEIETLADSIGVDTRGAWENKISSV